MSFLLTLSWAEDTRTELSSRVFSRVVSRSSRNTVSDLHHRTPFCSCLSTRLSSRRNRTMEGWGSRSTVNARSRRHRFGFSNSCRVPLSINGSDPTEPVHLDQFYFRNGGKLSNELKKSREEQRFSLRKIIINWLKLIRNSYSFFPIRWTREGNRRAGKFLRKSSSVT